MFNVPIGKLMTELREQRRNEIGAIKKINEELQAELQGVVGHGGMGINGSIGDIEEEDEPIFFNQGRESKKKAKKALKGSSNKDQYEEKLGAHEEDGIETALLARDKKMAEIQERRKSKYRNVEGLQEEFDDKASRRSSLFG